MRSVLAGLLVLLAGVRAVAAQGTAAPLPTITHVRGSVYEVADGAEHTIVVSTGDGILVVDPLTRPSATWLRDRLREMFPGVPVKYVVLTSPRVERIEGASLFAPAEVIAQRDFNDAVSDARHQDDPARYRYVRDVKSTFDARRTVSLGSHDVVLVSLPDRRRKAATAVYIPEDRLAFTVDPLVGVDVMVPPHTTIPVLSMWLTRVASIDVDSVMLGDGQAIDGPLLRARAAFVRDLLAATATGVEDGRTPDAIGSTALMSRHPDTAVPGNRSTLVRDLARSLVWWRLDLHGGLAYGHGSGVIRSCAATERCTEDTSLPRGTVAIWLSRRHVAVGVETGFGPQAWASHASTTTAEEFVQRQVQVSLLARYSTARGRPLSFAFLGGVATTHADTKGLTIVREAFSPTGGRFGIFETGSRPGLVAGVDVVRRLSRSFDVVVPVRVTSDISSGGANRWINTGQFQVGFRLSRRLWQALR